MIIGGLAVLVVGIILTFASAGITATGFVVGLATFFSGLVMVSIGIDNSSKAHLDDVNHQLQATYGTHFNLVNVYEDKVGFDLTDSDGQVRIHCDGKAVKQPDGPLVVAKESLTPVCQTELTAVTGH
jgi:hypothetical protein